MNPSLVSLSLTQPTAAVRTGTLVVLARQGDSVGPLTLEIPGLTDGIVAMDGPAGPGQYGYVRAGIAPGTYPRVIIHDASPAHLPDIVTDPFTINEPPAIVRGCTDPHGLNYNAQAGYEDGSCSYEPPAMPAPAFLVPLLQTLRFVVEGGEFETPDNTLFCQARRPGMQVRPYYFQLVEKGDRVRVQVLTSYAAVVATISRHGGPPVGPAVNLTQVLTLEGAAAPLAVQLSQDPLSGLTRLVAAAGGSLPVSLLGASRLTLSGAASGTYLVRQAVTATVASPSDYLVLNRPWEAVGAGAVTASWQLTGPGFNVWEADLPLASLPTDTYQVRLVATRAGWAPVEAISEPLRLQEQHRDSVVVDFRNGDNAYGTVFSTGFTPRLRVHGTSFRRKNGGTLSTYSGSDSSLTLTSSTATRLRTLETYGQPDYVHEKLFLICRLDSLLLDGVPVVGPAAYENEPTRSYPLSGGRADLQQQNWLGAGNGDDLGTADSAPDNALALHDGAYLLLRGR